MPALRTTSAARAKVNIDLRVLGRRADGYHEIDTLIVPVSLADRISLEIDPDGEDGVSIDVETEGRVSLSSVGPARSNLALRAARALKDASPGKFAGAVAIRLLKRIPAGAGLGGGSADAAAVLSAMNALCGGPLGRAELEAVAATLGSDVPAMLRARIVRAKGRGEILEDADGLPPDATRHIVLLFPPFAVPTAAVYGEFRESDRGLGPNDLQPAACRLFPRMADALDALARAGAHGVRMTGSGSAVFGFAESGASAREIASRVPGATAAEILP